MSFAQKFTNIMTAPIMFPSIKKFYRNHPKAYTTGFVVTEAVAVGMWLGAREADRLARQSHDLAVAHHAVNHTNNDVAGCDYCVRAREGRQALIDAVVNMVK